MASLRAAIDMHVQGLREDRLPVPEPSAIAEYVEIGPLARPRHRMVSIRGVETLGGFRVRLSLTDGSSREVDLGPYLTGPVFEPVRNDAAFFRSVRVDEELGTIVWPNGADIDPDVLILGRTPASFETASSGSRAG